VFSLSNKRNDKNDEEIFADSVNKYENDFIFDFLDKSQFCSLRKNAYNKHWKLLPA
jgi:hypothetical protein